MYNYTENNHVKFGYIKSETYNMAPAGILKRTSKDQIFTVDYNKCSHHPKSWKDECSIAIEKIYESTDLTLNIMFSGGIDGEVVVRTCMDLGIPFKVSIMRFKDDLNIHDISFAIIFCEQHNIKYDIIDLDLLKFLDTDMYDYAERTQAWHPTLPPIMWLADQIDGLPINCAGEHTIYKRVPDDYIPGESPYEPSLWDVVTKELYSSWYLHFIIQDRPAIPRFFEYTPELMYSLLKDPIMEDLVNNKIHGKLSLITSKFNVYSRYFDLIYREKTTGFEKIEEIEAVHLSNLLALYGDCTDIFDIEYNDLLKKLEYNEKL